MKKVTRPEDMSATGTLELIQQDDGDIIVAVHPAREDGLRSPGESVEFCTSGGHSPSTWRALNELMVAMALDNENYPRRQHSGDPLAPRRTDMKTYKEIKEKLNEQYKRLERQYCPTILGWRMQYEPVDDTLMLPRWHRSVKNVLRDAEHEQADGKMVMALWPQGAPADRAGMVAVFHPAFPGYMNIAAEMAATMGRVVHVVKERDTHWVYLFCHDPFVGCGDDDCYMRRQKDASIPCEPCDQWFDTDFHYRIEPSGESETISLS